MFVIHDEDSSDAPCWTQVATLTVAFESKRNWCRHLGLGRSPSWLADPAPPGVNTWMKHNYRNRTVKHRKPLSKVHIDTPTQSIIYQTPARGEGGCESQVSQVSSDRAIGSSPQHTLVGRAAATIEALASLVRRTSSTLLPQ